MVRIELTSEQGCSREPAAVHVFEDEKLVAKVVAQIEPKQGADGDYYSCVTLTQVDSND